MTWNQKYHCKPNKTPHKNKRKTPSEGAKIPFPGLPAEHMHLTPRELLILFPQRGHHCSPHRIQGANKKCITPNQKESFLQKKTLWPDSGGSMIYRRRENSCVPAERPIPPWLRALSGVTRGSPRIQASTQVNNGWMSSKALKRMCQVGQETHLVRADLVSQGKFIRHLEPKVTAGR